MADSFPAGRYAVPSFARLGYQPGTPLEKPETAYTLTAEEAGQLVAEIQRVPSVPQAS